MTGWLTADVTDLFGAEATAEESYDVLTVDVPSAMWTAALETARSALGCTYFDWLSAVDEGSDGFRVCAHVAALAPVRRLLLRTTLTPEAPVLASAVGVYAGAAWHERETHEMFGIAFEGHPRLDPLLLPDGFEGHPLRKDFVLAARVVKAWPGAKEPGESEHGGPRRRQMLPPGVPDPNEWGPLKGTLPAAPARPARGAARGDRPVRRTRSAGQGSASQSATAPAVPGETGTAGATGAVGTAGTEGGPGAGGATEPRRGGSAASGSASGREPRSRRSRSAAEGSASQRDVAPPRPAPSAPGGTRSSDAPWHHARPAFDAPKDAPGDTASNVGQARRGEAPGARPEAASDVGGVGRDEGPQAPRDVASGAADVRRGEGSDAASGVVDARRGEGLGVASDAVGVRRDEGPQAPRDVASGAADVRRGEGSDATSGAVDARRGEDPDAASGAVDARRGEDPDAPGGTE